MIRKWYNQMRQAAFSDFTVCLGKGEADSSILSGSTISPLLFSQLPRSGLFRRSPAWQISAGTNHKPAQSGVQNPCSLFFERSRRMMEMDSPQFNERNSIEWWRQQHAKAVEDCSKMAQDWFGFCEMMGVEVDSHEAVVDAICARYQNALFPFAQAAALMPPELDDAALLFAHFPSHFGGQTEIRVGDLRRAARLLGGQSE